MQARWEKNILLNASGDDSEAPEDMKVKTGGRFKRQGDGSSVLPDEQFPRND